MNLDDLPLIDHLEAHKQINGKVIFHADFDEQGNVTTVTAEWQGGDVIGVSLGLIEDADERWLALNADTGRLEFCQYEAEIIGVVPNPVGLYLARRLHNRGKGLGE